MSCCVRGCTNRPRPGQKELHFYRLPQDQRRRDMWLRAARRYDLLPSVSPAMIDRWNHYRVCSAHFITGKYSSDPTHPDYVPSVFSGRAWVDVGESLSGVKRSALEDSLTDGPCTESAHDYFKYASGDKETKTFGAKVTKLEEEHGLQPGDIIPFIYNPPEGSTEPGTGPFGLVRMEYRDVLKDHSYCRVTREPQDGGVPKDKRKDFLFCSFCDRYYSWRCSDAFLTHIKRHAADGMACGTEGTARSEDGTACGVDGTDSLTPK